MDRLYKRHPAVLPRGRHTLSLIEHIDGRRFKAERRRVSPAFSLLLFRTQATRHRRGFSLIELLVTIACIAVVASLLLPALQSAESRGRRIRCTSNLHEIGLSLRLYVDDTGTYPLASDSHGLGNWQRALRPSATDPVFYCPQQIRSGVEFRAYFPNEPFTYPHYGYNSSGGPQIGVPPQNPGLGGTFVWNDTHTGGTVVPAAENWVRAPSQMIAVGDGITFVRPPMNIPDLTPADPMYNIFPYVLQPQNYPGAGASHSGGANMFFCDAHVEFAKQSAWLSPSEANRCLWNADHLP